MRVTKLIWCAVCVAVLAAFVLVGCEELDPYVINSPADLQHKIDSIAAVKAGTDTGDTTHLIINTAIVGPEDNSAAWWTAFSDYFVIPSNKLLHLEFVNHGSGINNWNNWNLAVTNEVADRDGEGYAEYFLLRSDAYGWGNDDFDLGVIDQNYPDTDGDTDIWNDFRTTMQGAYVTIEVDHSATGNAFVTATAVGTNGTTLVQTYTQKVSPTADIVAFLVADASYFEVKKAYLLPSKVTAVEDVNPASIEINGAPASVELGNENFWGAATATVTFADGSSAQVDSTDLSFNVIPDMTTLGTKTVIVAYSKTKQGAGSTVAVSDAYTLEVTNAIVSIAATNINYYYFGTDDILFNPQGIIVTATYSDGAEAVLENNVLEFDHPETIPSNSGSQVVDIKYVGVSSTLTTTSTVTLVEGDSQVGANDFSTPFWTNSADVTVPSGESRSMTMYLYSDNAANWHSPYTVVRKADNFEYAVFRMDNFGWGANYPSATATSDWDWDVFQSSLHGSKVVVTITNHGNDTADVLYDVTYANGETHFQKYAGLTVVSSDLKFAVGTEGAYLVLVD